ncbi:MAG: lipopolysaccharide assembly protein LapA domain-containing protein [Acidimicrobiia bacterium]
MADRTPPAQSRMPSARLIIAGIVIVLVLWFALVNSQRVTIDFIIFERRARLIYVILGSAVLGAIAGALLRHRRRERRRGTD